MEQQSLEGILVLPKRNSQITTIAESIFQSSYYTTIFSFNHYRNQQCLCAISNILKLFFFILLPLLCYTFATGINFQDMLHHVCDVAYDRHSVGQSELVNLGTQTDSFLYGHAHCFLFSGSNWEF